MAASTRTVEDALKGVKHTVLVVSGKGGVGKSTVAAQLAVGLVRQGLRVGVLDLDLCGPSMVQLFGLDELAVHQSSEGWVPVFPHDHDRLCVMSIAFLLAARTDPVVWRGPRKSAMVTQFLRDVVWGELDYLVIDTPPGTSDEHLAAVQALAGVAIDGAVVVTTPQMVSLADVRREITFCETTGVRVLGLVENMSGFACPCCDEVTYVYGKGGGEALAKLRDIPFLGSIPIDPRIGTQADAGRLLLARASAPAADAQPAEGETSGAEPVSPATKPIAGIVEHIIAEIAKATPT